MEKKGEAVSRRNLPLIPQLPGSHRGSPSDPPRTTRPTPQPPGPTLDQKYPELQRIPQRPLPPVAVNPLSNKGLRHRPLGLRGPAVQFASRREAVRWGHSIHGRLGPRPSRRGFRSTFGLSS